jgi:DNA-nicking Smr family endonuclease
MTKPRRPRALKPDERRLWTQIARSVRPLPSKPPLPEPEPEPATASAEQAPQAPPPPPMPAPTRPSLPPLAPIERQTLLGLKRRKRPVDAVIDLHGMRQAEAHDALFAFLHRSQRAGHGVVLVVTGKGGAPSGDALFEERGVLRRVVPHWLRLPDLRPLVLGFEEAAGHHGGSGALYVRLRRRREMR